ncbi:MAG: hypothetical protein ABSD71_15695, partial [Bacteroidales bacterium]
MNDLLCTHFTLAFTPTFPSHLESTNRLPIKGTQSLIPGFYDYVDCTLSWPQLWSDHNLKLLENFKGLFGKQSLNVG